MPRHVGQRLLRDAVNGRLDARRQPLRKIAHRERRSDVVALAEIAAERLERRHEAVEPQHRRTEQLRQLAHLAERAADDLPRLRGASPNPVEGLGNLTLDEPQIRGHRRQRLPELVV